MSSDPVTDSALRRAHIGDGTDCQHPQDAREYLGQMGTAAFFQCTACDGVIIAW